MSYYANTSGKIQFKISLTKEQFETLEKYFLEIFDSIYESGNFHFINFCGEIKYDEDEIIELLSIISNDYDIEKGEIEYIGEDGGLWRHIYKVDDGKWYEQSGTVNYNRAIRTNYFHVQNPQGFRAFMDTVYAGRNKVFLFEKEDDCGSIVFRFECNAEISGLRSDTDEELIYDDFIDGLQKFVANDEEIVILNEFSMDSCFVEIITNNKFVRTQII